MIKVIWRDDFNTDSWVSFLEMLIQWSEGGAFVCTSNEFLDDTSDAASWSTVLSEWLWRTTISDFLPSKTDILKTYCHIFNEILKILWTFMFFCFFFFSMDTGKNIFWNTWCVAGWAPQELSPEAEICIKEY